MVPRGEVGLIFATIGAGLGVITGGVFSVIIIMVNFDDTLYTASADVALETARRVNISSYRAKKAASAAFLLNSFWAILL